MRETKASPMNELIVCRRHSFGKSILTLTESSSQTHSSLNHLDLGNLLPDVQEREIELLTNMAPHRALSVSPNWNHWERGTKYLTGFTIRERAVGVSKI